VKNEKILDVEEGVLENVDKHTHTFKKDENILDVEEGVLENVNKYTHPFKKVK